MSSNRSRSADIVLMIVIGVGAAAMMSASEYYGGLSGRAVTILLLAAAFFISWREFAHFSPIAKALGYFGVCLLLLLGGMIVADLINGSIGVISNILVLVVFGSVWYFAFYRKVRKAKRASAT